MSHRLTHWALFGALAFLPSGCVVFDATTAGFAMVSGQRLVTVSGEAAWAQPKQSVTAIDLKTGAMVAQGTLDDSKRYSVRVSLPLNDDLAIALHAPGSAALLLAPRGEKRQEERELDLTRGSTTVAWALGSALGGLPLPGNDAWKGSNDQWKAVGSRLPVTHGVLIAGSASVLDGVGVGSPATAASELDQALKASLDTLRVASFGHPRDLVLWPALVLGWSNALAQLPAGTGDSMAPQAAAGLDFLTVAEQIWALYPHVDELGALEIKVPLREPETDLIPQALPAVVQGLRYQVSGSMLPAPRVGTIARSAIRFQAGSLVLRVPDMPEGFASVDVEILGANAATLGRAESQGLVNRAVIRALTAATVAVSMEGTPTSRPGVR